MLKVTGVDYVKDYELLLTFSDGTRKLCDLKPYLTGEVFGEWLDLGKLTHYGLTGYTIEWANGADLAPRVSARHRTGSVSAFFCNFAHKVLPNEGIWHAMKEI